MTNHLRGETSPYLLQHVENPVDWYPWGHEALAKAKAEDKPIFLSIGYSACHWCHVMAQESFEDEQIAAILNERFVSIKVDREERPDLDRIYMAAVQALTGSGGWPMSVFLTPEGVPFYGGTYFPPVSRYGLPAFKDVLLAVSEAWRARRDQVELSAQQVLEFLQRHQAATPLAGEEGALGAEVLNAATWSLLESHDSRYGGWGPAPKFPQPMALEFLLRRHHATQDAQILAVVTHTLEAMARGGIYDQLGGGFHRYAVDDRWLVPHFEKMLYDNAQLAQVYLHAWQVTGDPLFRAIAQETLDYVAREMTDVRGGFFSSQDADSEGQEGKFFLWTLDEVRALLGSQMRAFADAYPLSAGGNDEGRNILSFVGTWEEREALANARQELFRARERRIRPGRDEKVLTSWNGLMLAAFAEGARVLGRDDYRRIAERNAEFLLRELRSGDGRLLHVWKAGQAKLAGYLEDYSFLIWGLLSLYRATFEERWYLAARDLAETMIAHYGAPDGCGFFDTADDHERLITRPRELQDNAVPSGSAMAALVLLQLSGLSLESRYEELARRAIAQVGALASQYPLAFAQWLNALDYALTRREVAIVGAPGAMPTRALLAICDQGYHPCQIVACGDPSGGGTVVPLLRERQQIGGLATAYVCENSVCRPPVTDPEALRALLGSGSLHEKGEA